jgi:hypothetical protein
LMEKTMRSIAGIKTLIPIVVVELLF